MSKVIRNVISSVIILGIFSGIQPNHSNLIVTKAYAEEKEDYKPHLKSIYLTEGDNIKFSEEVYSYIVDLRKDVDEAIIKVKPEDSNDTVKINGQVVTDDDRYMKDLNLDKGKNTVEIEVIDDKTQDESKYTVYVFRGGKDAIYLNDIIINGNTIGFDKSRNSYNVELDEGSDLVELESVPEDTNYLITVNDRELDERNLIKLKFKGIGKYTINIQVKDTDTKRIGNYTLNIYLGIPVSPNVSDSINSVIKPNQWVMVNGRWRFSDVRGQYLKNTWYYDSKYKSYFHFNSIGNMQTGWIYEGGNWYYLNSKGEMQTGWLRYEDNWYFLNQNGAMVSGWFFNDGSWYYMNIDGSMATDWIISDGNWYHLNSKGAMETGWLYYGKKWYYLGNSGAMMTDWVESEDEWYFFNKDGSMKSGEWLEYEGSWYYLNYVGNMRHGVWLYVEKDDKYYYFNSDGTMRKSPITLEGYTYKFNEDGSVNFN